METNAFKALFTRLWTMVSRVALFVIEGTIPSMTKHANPLFGP